jgi:hypothetical protein
LRLNGAIQQAWKKNERTMADKTRSNHDCTTNINSAKLSTAKTDVTNVLTDSSEKKTLLNEAF